MRALVRRAGGVRLEDIAPPRLRRDDDVLIQVLLAGVCRTDVYVARGALPVREPRVIGHEFAGVVLACGPAAGFRAGERVTVDPAIACGACAGCRAGGECAEPLFMGVQAEGAFAEQVVVPAAHVLRTPEGMAAKRAAYVEPVAAALAVLNAPLDPAGRGLILGDNRIATLTARILAIHGFADVTHATPDEPPQDAAPFDFVIETQATAASLAVMFDRLKPHGLGVLKSRPAAAVPINLAQAVRKNLRLHAVGYGPFERAIALLASGALAIDDLLGEVFALEDFERAFALSEASDSGKIFFAVSPPAAPDAQVAEAGRLAHA